MSLLWTLRPLVCAIVVAVCWGAAPKNRQGKFEAEKLEAEVSQDGHIAMHNSLKPSFKDSEDSTEFIELEDEEQEQELEQEDEQEEADDDAQESAGCRRRACHYNHCRRRNCHRRRVPCLWGTWKAWSQCKFSEGSCKVSRDRSISRAVAHGGYPCVGSSQDKKPCECPVHCEWGKWNGWQKCSKPCGGGEQKRNRPVAKAAAHGGKKCDGAAEEKKKCNAHKCPIDCVYGEWGEWADCSVTCGNGTRKHTREVETEAQHGGKECEGEAEEEGPCDPVPEKCGAFGSKAFSVLLLAAIAMYF